LYQEYMIDSLFTPESAAASCRHRDFNEDDRPSPVVQAVIGLKHFSCRWPIGHPKKRPIEFRFCCAPRLEGKPYCEEHVKRAIGVAGP